MRGKVLIINDSKFESIVLKDLFNEIHYDAEISDEFHGLEKIEKIKPDIVVVNLIMRSTRGDLFIKQIKRRWAGLKCLLSSSNSIKLEDFADTVVDGVFRTPVKVEKLKQVLFELNDQKFCSQCSREMQKDFLMCPYCGEKL